MTETAITRPFVRALKENYTAIASAKNKRPRAPFIRFKVMEEVGLTVIRGFKLGREQEHETSDLILTLHSAIIEAKNAELIKEFRSTTTNSDGSVTTNDPEHRPIYIDNVIATFLTAMRLSEYLSKIEDVPDDIKPVIETKDDLRLFVNRLCGGTLIPTPPLIITGADVLWRISPPYMSHLIGKENHTIFTLHYGQANEFLAEIESIERDGGR